MTITDVLLLWIAMTGSIAFIIYWAAYWYM